MGKELLSMLHIQNFTKSYGDFLVLSIEELRLNQGLYWVQGENGSGKTTLFKSLSGMLPCNGEINLQGISLHTAPLAYRMKVNYADPEPAYPSFLTAKDIVRFIGSAKKSTVREQDEWCDSFGITNFINQACSTYSSGMLKKLSLTLAFLGDPRLIILDEPFITLDKESRPLLYKAIKNGLTNGILFLLSSHQSFDDSELIFTQSFTIKNKTLQRS